MRQAERGTAIITTMIVLVALLAGGGVLVGLQLQSTRSAGVVKSEITSLHCAESGLAAARNLVETNYAVWTPSLCNPVPPRGTGTCVIGSADAEPVWLRAPAVPHDLDGNGTTDFYITLVDNEDESPNDPATNSDQDILIISTCVMNPETPAQVTEHVRRDPVTGKLSRRLWLRSE